MYRLDDTIAAIASSPLIGGRAGRSILRVSGPGAFDIFNLQSPVFEIGGDAVIAERGVRPFYAGLTAGIWVDGMAYCFPSPNSYTGQNLLELHCRAAQPAVEALFEMIVQSGIRQAGPGEFTQRAYLNGKLDLAQAEAVMHVVSSASEGRIAAAERLLSGGLAAQVKTIRDRMLELLSLLEAGLDFSEEDIEFVRAEEAVRRIGEFSSQIQCLLDGAVRCEEFIELPSVGLAGLANAGKSSLMNAMTARLRSIISDYRGTTRDVLTELLELDCGPCILFDCAGLGGGFVNEPDELGRQAAIQALATSSVVVVCLDLSIDDPSDAEVFKFVKTSRIIVAGTKADLLNSDRVEQKRQILQQRLGINPVITSSKTGYGIPDLKAELSKKILSVCVEERDSQQQIGLNLRHREKLQSVLKRLNETADEIHKGCPEIAAMLLRQARQELGGVEHEHVDERILDKIFSKFCIGK